MTAIPTAAQIEEAWEYLNEAERAELLELLKQDTRVWWPVEGPQTLAYNCTADITGYGGAAGGGKTDLLCGTALTKHERVLFIRREKAQTEGIIQRLEELVGARTGYSSQKSQWRMGKRLFEFGGLDNPGDEKRWQGRAHDLKAIDEATEQREAQVRFVIGWNRTSNKDIKPRVIMTFNPPTSAEGQWVIRFFGPWLDHKHPNPAAPGELRWFTTVGDNADYEVPDNRPFVIEKDGSFNYSFKRKDVRAEDIRKPLSRTFIPALLTDNPFYMATDYMATLQAMPEPLRSQMLYGDFRAGMKDDAMQVIPTAWVEAAMDRWSARQAEIKANGPGPMDSMGVDVARGGSDQTIIARRYGNYFDDLICHPGADTPNGPTVAGHVLVARKDGAPIHIDVIGVGASPYDFLISNNVHTIGVNNSSKSLERSLQGSIAFANTRAEQWWQLREALDPDLAKVPLSLPDDTRLLADLCAPRWKLTPGGILVESKDDIRKRLGRSPDRGDAVVLANRVTMKRADAERLNATSVVAEKDYYKEILG